MYFSALLPHWLWLNERKDISVSWEPTSCQALCWVLYTQLIHVILTKPSETYQYENRIRLSNLPKVIPEWLHCVDEMNANPVIFLQSRCSLQSSTLSTIILFEWELNQRLYISPTIHHFPLQFYSEKCELLILQSLEVNRSLFKHQTIYQQITVPLLHTLQYITNSSSYHKEKMNRGTIFTRK